MLPNHFSCASIHAIHSIRIRMSLLAFTCSKGISMTNASPMVAPTRAREVRAFWLMNAERRCAMLSFVPISVVLRTPRLAAPQGVLGTNPISVAARAENDDSYVLDMATTTVPYNKACSRLFSSLTINHTRSLAVSQTPATTSRCCSLPSKLLSARIMKIRKEDWFVLNWIDNVISNHYLSNQEITLESTRQAIFLSIQNYCQLLIANGQLFTANLESVFVYRFGLSMYSYHCFTLMTRSGWAFKCPVQ